MRVIIAGGSGKIGQVLAQALHHKGHEVVVLSRSPSAAPWRMVGWDGATLGRWAEEFEGADAVINLAGQSVNCRYTPHNRKIITDSRVKSTKVIGEAILRSWSPPGVWLHATMRRALRSLLCPEARPEAEWWRSRHNESRGGAPKGERAPLSTQPHPSDAAIGWMRLSALRFPSFRSPD